MSVVVRKHKLLWNLIHEDLSGGDSLLDSLGHIQSILLVFVLIVTVVPIVSTTIETVLYDDDWLI